MVKIGSVRWHGKCGRHPRYDPETDGLGGIRGGCKRCELLLEIWTQHAKLVRMMREFGTPRESAKAPREDEQARRQMMLPGVVQ
jgi:hypothetical protein